MKTEFTKGEWAIKNPNNSETEISSEYGHIAILPSNLISSEFEANARLIAAAPEMFDALLKAQSLLNAIGGRGDCIRAIDKAIKKATGYVL